MRIADYVMEKLNSEGVNHIFMVTGRGVLYLSDAAAKLETLNCVSVHHEQAAAYAAMAYSQKNEQLGACLVSTGCAGTNAITGVLCAWQDDVPCVFVSGQNTLKETTRYTNLPVRTFGQQEADIVKIVEPITKYSTMITDANQVVYEVEKALHLAKNGRKGPVWIDIPLDIQNMRIEPEELEHFVPDDDETFQVKKDEIDLIIKELNNASRPVVLVGSGVRSAHSISELKEFVEKYKIPVLYSSSAVDVYGANNELSIGAVGTMAASRAANFALQNSDLVFVLGCRMSSMITGADKSKFAREAKVIAVDIDKYEYQKENVKVDSLIVADVKSVLGKLIKVDVKLTDDEWVSKCKHWKSIFPKCEEKYKTSEKVDLYYLADCLTQVLSKDAVVVTDAGLEELLIPTSVEFSDGQRALHPASQGAMGYALPAAIGAHCAGAKQVVAVIGDGSVMMNLQELQTIDYNKYPVKILIVNNNCYAVIRKRQQDLFRTRTVGTDKDNGVSCPDFKKVADCFNIHYERIETSDELSVKLKDVINYPESIICEIISVEDQEYITSAFARNAEKRFVQRPLEDQAPFLDRELFLSEMVIEPIDQ